MRKFSQLCSMFRFPRITSSLLSVPSYVGSLRQKSQQHRTAPKVFFVPKTIKRADGAITEKLVQCTCNNANDFKALRKQVGELVGPQGNLVQNFNDVVNDAVYDVTLDSAALQSSVVNLIGTSNSFARSAELQMVHSLRESLLGLGSITVNNETVQVATVEEVFDHISMNNPAIQKTALTPDAYAYGKLTDGRAFEVVGDTKIKISGRVQKNLGIVKKYVRFLSTLGTTVSGSFSSDRVPAPVIIGVLGTYVHDADAVEQAQKAGVVLLTSSGKVLQPATAAAGVTLLRREAASKIALLDEEDDDCEDE